HPHQVRRSPRHRHLLLGIPLWPRPRPGDALAPVSRRAREARLEARSQGSVRGVLAPLSPQPLLLALAPDRGRLEDRCRQLALAQIARAEAPRELERRRVRGVDAVDALRPTEGIEGPVDRRRGTLAGVAFAPGRANQAPADFGARPSFGPPRPEPADPAAA